MRLTKERTNRIITEASDISGIYRHVVVIELSDTFQHELLKYCEVAKPLASLPAFKHLSFEDHRGYLFKTREDTEKLFPGWTELSDIGSWSYLEMSDHEFDDLCNEYYYECAVQDLLVTPDGYFYLRFCQEVECHEYMYYCSVAINIADIISQH